jgi:DNA gyrase subunit A
VGIRSAVVNTKTGNLIGVKTLTGDSQEVIIISSQGQTIRLGLKNIPALGRATQGVRIMRMNDGDSVVSLALVDKNGEDEPAKNAGKPPVAEAVISKPAAKAKKTPATAKKAAKSTTKKKQIPKKAPAKRTTRQKTKK